MLLKAGKCTEAVGTVEAITRLMAVPLVQGMLRYAYKADPKTGPGGAKEVAEGWAFARGILPQIHACSPVAAAIVVRNMNITAQRPVADGYQAVKQAVEGVYSCLGMSCADVGGLLQGPGVYYAGMEPCSPLLVLAQLPLQTDVTEHARIDLDQLEFATLLKAGDWAGAWDIYSHGRHSHKSQSMRTLQGFSTNISASKADAPPYRLFVDFYGSPTYADDFVRAAVAGTGPFSNQSNVMREECANKGAVYGNSWMYVLLELYDAIDDCQSGNLLDNDQKVQALEEAWAFYAGSLEGPDGRGSGMQPYGQGCAFRGGEMVPKPIPSLWGP
jgi:hypothetical protein